MSEDDMTRAIPERGVVQARTWEGVEIVRLTGLLSEERSKCEGLSHLAATKDAQATEATSRMIAAVERARDLELEVEAANVKHDLYEGHLRAERHKVAEQAKALAEMRERFERHMATCGASRGRRVVTFLAKVRDAMVAAKKVLESS